MTVWASVFLRYRKGFYEPSCYTTVAVLRHGEGGPMCWVTRRSDAVAISIKAKEEARAAVTAATSHVHVLGIYPRYSPVSATRLRMLLRHNRGRVLASSQDTNHEALVLDNMTYTFLARYTNFVVPENTTPLVTKPPLGNILSHFHQSPVPTVSFP